MSKQATKKHDADKTESQERFVWHLGHIQALTSKWQAADKKDLPWHSNKCQIDAYKDYINDFLSDEKGNMFHDLPRTLIAKRKSLFELIEKVRAELLKNRVTHVTGSHPIIRQHITPATLQVKGVHMEEEELNKILADIAANLLQIHAKEFPTWSAEEHEEHAGKQGSKGESSGKPPNQSFKELSTKQ